MFSGNEQFNTLTFAGRLSQQYLVDQYVKIDSERLLFLRLNQVKLRDEDYTRLREMHGDSAGMNDEFKAVRAERLLPSTFVGGDHYMRQALHDMSAVMNQLCHPDVFVTMTCNSN